MIDQVTTEQNTPYLRLSRWCMGRSPAELITDTASECGQDLQLSQALQTDAFQWVVLGEFCGRATDFLSLGRLPELALSV